MENEVEKPIKKLIKKLKEKLAKEKLKEIIKNHKKIVISLTVTLCALLVIYIGMAFYFMKHFYFGSTINCINVSGKAVEEVEEQMKAELQAYRLELRERGGKTEQIRADEIDLRYNSDGEFKSFKDKQKPFAWITTVFNTKTLKMTEGVTYDKESLKKRIDKLSCFDSSAIIEPKNPSFKYENNSYVIVDEVLGNKVDKDILYEQVSESVLKKEASIDLEAINCYFKPQYTSSSPKIVDTKNLLNKYTSTKITYSFGEDKEILDGSIINKWLAVDEDFTVNLDEAKARGYIDILSKTYNTAGKSRSFATSSGKTINIGGGDYGWSINRTKETEALIAAIKEGQTISKEPVYSQTALARGSNDIGNTYVEIDLTKQHLWFYKNGELIADGNIVTGNVSAGHTTPSGIYRLKYKQKDAVLRGPGYAAPVTFWMPFNGGIGIHDASWRNTFGGNIYKTNGSHGCINSPYNLAKAVFENIQAGTPVVCYN